MEVRPPSTTTKQKTFAHFASRKPRGKNRLVAVLVAVRFQIFLRRALRFTFGFAEIEFTVFLIQKSPIA